MKLLLSDALWRSQFAADPGIVGRELRVDGQPHAIVGVMPRGFEALSPGVRLWRPLAFTPEDRSDARRHSNNYWNIGRLKPGATVDQARTQIDALNAANLEGFPQYKDALINAGFRTKVERLADHLVRHVKPVLYLLWGGASFVLLIGFLNVANLALVRSRARAKEMATRVALGAPPVQLARQLLVENLLLTVVAAGVGLLLGVAALRGVSAFDLQGLPYGDEIRMSTAPALYALALALAIGVAMSLVPLATALREKPSSVLRVEGRGATGTGGARTLRRALVVAQVAFTFVLLLGAGLLLASFARVLQVDPGFSSERVATSSVSLPASRYPDDDARRRFTDEALRRLRAIPGVAAAGATSTIPFGGSYSDSVIIAEGYVMKPGESLISPSQVDVTPGFFEAMGAKLVRGRFFEEKDTAGALPVAIVDQRLAVKTLARDAAIAGSLRAAIAGLDRELPVFDAHSMDERAERALGNRRGPARLALGFGVLALLLAAVGLYGVLAYLVTQRSREIAVRIALGSSARGVFDLVMREGLLLLGIGLVVGGVSALALRPLLESQLFGVRAGDPRVMLAVVLLLGLVALAACALPARRAARIEPRAVLTD